MWKEIGIKRYKLQSQKREGEIKVKKMIKTMLIMLIVVFITIPCFGTGEIDIETFEPTYKTDMGTAKTLGGKILGYIVNIAAVSSVCIIAYIGLKFMVGSVEQRAEYKKYYMPLIIGMFLVVGSGTILSAFLGNDSNDSGSHECASYIVKKYNGKYFYYECDREGCDHVCNNGYTMCEDTVCDCGRYYSGTGDHHIEKKYNGKFIYYGCDACNHICDYKVVCSGGVCECGHVFSGEGHEKRDYSPNKCIRCDSSLK